MYEIAVCHSLRSRSLAAPAAAAGAAAAGPAVIVTTGEGVVKQAPDRAWVTIAAESRARTAQEAQRLNTDAMTAVVEKIKASGIAADAIQTTGYNLQPEFDYANGKQTLRGYVARNQVQVRVDALAKTGDVIARRGGDRRDQRQRRAVRSEGPRRGRARGAAAGGARRAAPRRRAAAGAGVQIERVIRIEEQRDDGDIGRGRCRWPWR